MRVSKVSKEQILEHARRELLSRGFQAVRVEDIAAALGISKKTFYQHFESKQALVRAVALTTMESVFAEAGAVLERKGDTLAKIDALIGTVGARLGVLPPSAPAELQRGFPAVFAELMERRHQFLQGYVKMIAEGQRRREIRRDYSAQALCAAMMAVIEALGQPDFLQRSGLKLADTAGLIRDFLVGGLSARQQEERQ
jgi:AcrR family transcriptional regulator